MYEIHYYFSFNLRFSSKDQEKQQEVQYFFDFFGRVRMAELLSMLYAFHVDIRTIARVKVALIEHPRRFSIKHEKLVMKCVVSLLI